MEPTQHESLWAVVASGVTVLVGLAYKAWRRVKNDLTSDGMTDTVHESYQKVIQQLEERGDRMAREIETLTALLQAANQKRRELEADLRSMQVRVLALEERIATMR